MLTALQILNLFMNVNIPIEVIIQIIFVVGGMVTSYVKLSNKITQLDTKVNLLMDNKIKNK